MADAPNPERHDEEERRGETPFERVVLTMTDDPGLRPVLLVVVLIAGTFVSFGVILALRQANLFAMAGIAGLTLMTFAGIDGEIRAAKRITAGVWAIASVWIAAAAIGFTMVSLGAF